MPKHRYRPLAANVGHGHRVLRYWHGATMSAIKKSVNA
jgi:hypothetical protein